jgi:hypothetical protein
MSAGHGVVGLNLRRPWLVANFAAFTIGAAAWGGTLRALEQPYYGAEVSTMEAARIQAISSGASTFLFGAAVGVAQWLVLRHVIRAGWWGPATCLGWGLGGVVMGFNAGGSLSTIGPDAGPVPPAVAFVVGLPLLVLLLGSVQWWLLRREFDGAGWWPLVNMGGLLGGFLVGFAVAMIVPWLASTDFPSAQALWIVGAAAGPVYGAVTWPFLAQLRRRSAPSQATPARLP